jgi:phosphoserine phosphatase
MTGSSYIYVATLVSPPDQRVLTDQLIAEAGEALGCAYASDVLSDHHAVDLFFDSHEPLFALRDRLLLALNAAPIDVIVQPVKRRRKKLFLADMDSTMIRQECIDELADQVGLKAHVAAITERAMNGELAFEPALRERVALLKNLPVSIIDEVLATAITLTSGAPELIATLRKNGVYTCLVSGGFTLFTGPIAARLGFDEHRANHLIVEKECLTGFVAEPIVGRAAKRETLLELRTRFALKPSDTIAVGDGANDLDMLQEAGLGLAFHAKPSVAAAAHAKIMHSDLTALLYAQGYKEAEWVGT